MLVTLEGLDGSGKTTVWESLHEIYPDATFTREPTSGRTGSWYGDAVYRSIEDEDADSLAELFLYTADHADHLSRIIEPALESGDLVISDRYSDSRYAYQGATLEGEINQPLEYIVDIHSAFSIEPDLTIYLDLDPETAAERSGSTNKFERETYLESVRENYERLIERSPDRFVRIDATQPADDVLDRVTEVLEDALDREPEPPE